MPLRILMNLNKADIVKLISATFLFGAAAWVWTPSDSNYSESESQSIEISSSQASKNKAEQVPSGEQCLTVPSRMLNVTAPNAHEFILAGRLLREAADPTFAAATIKIKKSLELATMQKEIWEHKAARAESEARYAEAIARKKDLDDGIRFSEASSGMTELEIIRAGRHSSLDDDVSENVSMSSDEPFNARLGNTDPNRMFLNVNGKWFKGVTVGQFVGRYKVTKFDEDLRCAYLASDYGNGNEVPVCYN